MSINILLTVTDNTDNIIKESTITLHFSPRHYFQIKLRTKKYFYKEYIFENKDLIKDWKLKK